MKRNQITEETIKELVDLFYSKVAQDIDLAPIFLNAIGKGHEAWKPHLETMYNFWSSMFLGSGRYNGRPMPKHIALPPFDVKLFDRWLALFSEATHEVHTDEIAALYMERSKIIAANLKAGVSRMWSVEERPD